MAAYDKHGVICRVGQRAELQVPGDHYLDRRKITAVGTNQVTLGDLGVQSSASVEIMEHSDNPATTGADWASIQ